MPERQASLKHKPPDEGWELGRFFARWLTLAIARQRYVQIVGKANLSEFAVAPSGFNEYFGTPASPLSSSRKLLPGGSSCGSAVAVASGMADVAFGTDTAGSIRVPAAWCGVVGLKTTHGLVPIDGVFPIEPEHLDTVGPMGKDIAHTVQGMDLLQDGFAALYAAAVVRNRGYRVALFDAMLAESIDDWSAALDRHRPCFAVIYEDNFNYLTKMCLLRMRTAAMAMIDAARKS